MKLLILCILLSVNVFAHEKKCKPVWEPVGIYPVYCPKGTVVDATRTFVPAPNFPLRTRVRCVRLKIVCTDTKPLFDDTDIRD